MKAHEPSTEERRMIQAGAQKNPILFEAFYAEYYPQIAGFVRRRVHDAEADDVLAQVFAVAWRRFDHIPDPPQDRLWLFGVARNCLAEHARSSRRRTRLSSRVAQDMALAPRWPAGSDPRFEPVLAAMETLPPAELEALQLVLWDELTHADAAAVAGCSVHAFESRYRRARNAVRDAVSSVLAAPVHPASPSSSRRSATRVRGNAS